MFLFSLKKRQGNKIPLHCAVHVGIRRTPYLHQVKRINLRFFCEIIYASPQKRLDALGELENEADTQK